MLKYCKTLDWNTIKELNAEETQYLVLQHASMLVNLGRYLRARSIVGVTRITKKVERQEGIWHFKYTLVHFLRNSKKKLWKYSLICFAPGTVSTLITSVRCCFQRLWWHFT
ncbi:uncharacterized protein [Montipora foliosa]|uniref:uncharacterized protein n=1 Tax=Montipora foliosa TaxID=591990 RepID=UPI0035F202CF